MNKLSLKKCGCMTHCNCPISEINSEWISVKEMTLEHLKEGDYVLTIDEKGNMIPYKFFLGGLNMIGKHSDNNRKITHWISLPKLPV